MRFLYNVLLAIAVVVAIPVVIVRSFSDARYRYRLGDRLGFPSLSLTKPVVWCHAASVGEVLMALPFLQEIKSRYNHLDLLVTTQTPSGHQTVMDKLGPDVHTCLVPIDMVCVVRRSIRRIRPQVAILFETELWPNLIAEFQAHQIPVMLLNARISQNSFRWYRLLSSLLRPLWPAFSVISAQGDDDRQRFLHLGADEAQIHVSGNLKYDRRIAPLSDTLRTIIADFLTGGGRFPLLVLGSLHEDEFQLLVEALQQIRSMHPDLRVLWAPRHREAVPLSERLLTQAGFSCCLRSAAGAAKDSSPPVPVDVMILDSYGELASLYEVATVVFVGGSLSPTGGQNMLEPAYFKKPVLFGPHTENFKDIANNLLNGEGAYRVRDGNDLVQVIHRFLTNPQESDAMGIRAFSIIEGHRGAMNRTLALITPFLDKISETDTGKGLPGTTFHEKAEK